MKVLIMMLVSLTGFAQSNKDLLDMLVANETHGKIVSVLETPTATTSISATYDFQEFALQPEEVVYFYVPEELSTMSLSQISFSHHQKGHVQTNDWKPGLTSVLVYTKDMPGDELRYWAGHSSGKLGAKFAEYRKNSEMDSLFEWPRMGHKGLRSDKVTTLIRPNVVRVQNVGSDTVWFSKLYIETIPQSVATYEEIVFTPESTFGDALTMKGRHYGGGQDLRGTFPNSLRLDSQGHRHYPQLPETMTVEKEKIFIKLTEGTQLAAIDIMCGDSHPDQIRNKDGGWGTSGNAALSVYVENTETGERRYLVSEKNVGPQGVISASDVMQNQKISASERLVIENKKNKSTAYIMALRIGINHEN